MSVTIRLARRGAKKRPYYSIVAADSRGRRDGRFLEKLGTYNPLLPKEHDERVVLKSERIEHWLGHGAQVSDRVARFLDTAGIRPGMAKTRMRGTGKRAQAIAAKKAETDAAAAEKAAADAAVAEKAKAEAAATEKAAAEAAAATAAEEEASAQEEAPAEEEPAAEDAPAEEEAPAEEVSVEETPAEETASDETSGDKASG